MYELTRDVHDTQTNLNNGANWLARNVRLGVFGPVPHSTSHCGRNKTGRLAGVVPVEVPSQTPRDKRMGGTARSHKPFPREPGRIHSLISIAPHPYPHSAHGASGPRTTDLQPPLARRDGQVKSAPDRNRKHTKPQHPPPPCRIPSRSAPLPILPIHNLLASQECIAV